MQTCKLFCFQQNSCDHGHPSKGKLISNDSGLVDEYSKSSSKPLKISA